MSEDQLYSFETGPYEMLNYNLKTKEGKVVIEINNGDLGRLVIEDQEALNELREGLNKAEIFFKENARRQEEL